MSTIEELLNSVKISMNRVKEQCKGFRGNNTDQYCEEAKEYLKQDKKRLIDAVLSDRFCDWEEDLSHSDVMLVRSILKEFDIKVNCDQE
jgi:hypothetical protein